MGRFGGIAAVAGCAAALIATPAAHAAQGSDVVSRWDTVFYVADPGEANDVLVESWAVTGLHLRDRGAVIRWVGAPVPGIKQCFGGGHDVWCLGGYGFLVQAELGDGNDVYRALRHPGEIDLGPGADRAIGGPEVEVISARDGVRDTISCGGEHDTVEADAADVVAADCEVVSVG